MGAMAAVATAVTQQGGSELRLWRRGKTWATNKGRAEGKRAVLTEEHKVAR